MKRKKIILTFIFIAVLFSYSYIVSAACVPQILRRECTGVCRQSADVWQNADCTTEYMNFNNNDELCSGFCTPQPGCDASNCFDRCSDGNVHYGACSNGECVTGGVRYYCPNGCENGVCKEAPPQLPGKPTNLVAPSACQPDSSSDTMPVTVTFRWNPSTGAEYYYVYVWAPEQNKWIEGRKVSASECGAVCQDVWYNFPSASSHWWMVRAVNSQGSSDSDMTILTTQNCAAPQPGFCTNNNQIDSGEECDGPNIALWTGGFGNTGCPQQYFWCSGIKFCARPDTYGNCDNCDCVEDSYSCVCIKDACGASCASNSDCSSGYFCNQNTCSCELSPSNECTPGTSEFKVCGDCGTKSRICQSNGMWGSYGTCYNQGECSPGTTTSQGCINSGYKVCSQSCQYGSCIGESECNPGQQQTLSCGFCGHKTRTCQSNGMWGSYETCQNSGECSPGTTSTEGCSGGGFKRCLATCQYGGCTNEGVCYPGTFESESCGDKCGIKYRVCGSDFQWLDWGPCTSEGTCVPGTNDVVPCGDQGHKSRTCNSNCEWNPYGDCTGEHECHAGAIEQRSCGNCGTQIRMCASNGEWADWGSCQGEGVCSPNSTETKTCTDNGRTGTQTRACSQYCTWLSFGQCIFPQECAPGNTDSRNCGKCGTQTRICNSQGLWNNFGSCTGEGICYPSTTETRACGNGGSQYRTCENFCQWFSWSDCSGERECTPGNTESQNCGNCGTQSRVCQSNGMWGSYGICQNEGECSPGITTTQGCNYGGYKLCSQSCHYGYCIGEGVCSPGQTQTEQCGYSGVGACSKGTTTRTCQSDFSWSSWSTCIGNTQPGEEVCNNQDDDCDGQVDEGGVCEGLFVKSVQILEDCVKPGDTVVVKVVLENTGRYRFDDMQITVTSDVLNLREQSDLFDIGRGDDETRLINFPTSSTTKQGYYELRIYISNGAWHSIVYRDFVLNNMCGCNTCQV